MKAFFRTLYSLLLLGAGIMHFVRKGNFLRMVPKILPFRRFIVLISGVFELIFSLMLWVKKGQQITGRLLALFMIAIFPANVYMAVNMISFKPEKKPNPLLQWLRLPMQIPLIIGALKVGRGKR
ncbi:Uncharacterized membrane protein [Gracilibacillus ureilyticus]|uniref:Uncharacterized membrane protein n=1 Tax=Gracilibacillus ureilyticus TaxID=531814 RepID=A0A1H9N9P3_9BACI|nr:hypothetical protein [Gracilibacillus ureilyticus]SER32467.1 Uncharacterized membrane protein [Gracilibacillus ureilyticus]